jgi:hypothetical protein
MLDLPEKLCSLFAREVERFYKIDKMWQSYKRFFYVEGQNKLDHLSLEPAHRLG